MKMSYKDEQEEFVSNLSGTSLSDLVVCLALLPVSILLVEVVQSFTRKGYFVQDILFLVLPITLGLTLFSEWITIFLCFCGCMVTLLVILRKYYVCNSTAVVATPNCCNEVQNAVTGNSPAGESLPNESAKGSSVKLSYITLFRGGTMLLTCLSILAIDFHVYPRRFGKTELFGFSLMDTGAGTFVIASAITSKYARNVKQTMSSGGLQYLVVLALGIGRMVTIKMLGYQEHVSEYGTTWNFFVTLCCVWFIADVVHNYFLYPRNMNGWPSTLWDMIQCIQIPVLSIFIVGIYQSLLTYGGLTDFICNAPRNTSFFASNREGILSLCGYVPIYMLSEWFSSHFFFKRSSAQSDCRHLKTDFWNILKGEGEVLALFFSAAFCGISWYLSVIFFQSTSRRLTNMAFVFMILFLASLMMISLIIVDILGRHLNSEANLNMNSDISLLRLPLTTLSILSKHQLVVFMFANFVTGLINMSIRTLYISDILSFIIIYCYISVVVAFSWLFECRTRNACGQ